MPNQDEAIGENGKSGGDRPGDERLESIAKSIDTIKGVVSDLVTKVSDIERSVQERQDLAEIMRGMSGEEVPVGRSVPEEKQQGGDNIVGLLGSIESKFGKALEVLNRRIDDVVAQMQVKQLEVIEPDFNTKIRPIAYQISKEPGMGSLSVEQLTSIAKGRLALKQNEELQNKLKELTEKIAELESRAQGDKPGIFVGISEPPKKMTAEEAFDDAFKKSGADRLLR